MNCPSDETVAEANADQTATPVESVDAKPSDAPKTGWDWMFRFRGWLVILTLVVALVVSLIVRYPMKPLLWEVLVGGPLLILGVLTRVWARSHFLRGSDTRRIRSARLITGGPYGHVRNPLYVGNILVQGAAVFCFCGWIAGVVVSLCLWIIYQGVILSEEAVLVRSHGEPYKELMAKSPRWIPRMRRDPTLEITSERDWKTAFYKERQRAVGGLLVFATALIWALV